MAERGTGPTGAVVALVAVALVLVAAITGGTLLLLDRGDDPATTATGGTTASSTGPTTGPSTGSSTGEPADEVPTSGPAATLTAPSGPGPVEDLPSGLLCRDLEGDGYDYAAAVTYWRAEGEPDRMDEDLDGIPCQTVYSPADVSAFWGESAVPDDVARPVESLPAGLLCRDLEGDGFSYSDAVAYWFVWDLPDRMDSDLNGIPCETVYPASDVDAYWNG